MARAYSENVVEALGVFMVASVSALRDQMPEAPRGELLILIQQHAEESLAEGTHSPQVRTLVRDMFRDLWHSRAYTDET